MWYEICGDALTQDCDLCRDYIDIMPMKDHSFPCKLDMSRGISCWGSNRCNQSYCMTYQCILFHILGHTWEHLQVFLEFLSSRYGMKDILISCPRIMTFAVSKSCHTLHIFAFHLGHLKVIMFYSPLANTKRALKEVSEKPSTCPHTTVLYEPTVRWHMTICYTIFYHHFVRVPKWLSIHVGLATKCGVRSKSHLSMIPFLGLTKIPSWPAMAKIPIHTDF